MWALQDRKLKKERKNPLFSVYLSTPHFQLEVSKEQRAGKSARSVERMAESKAAAADQSSYFRLHIVGDDGGMLL